MCSSEITERALEGKKHCCLFVKSEVVVMINKIRYEGVGLYKKEEEKSIFTQQGFEYRILWEREKNLYVSFLCILRDICRTSEKIDKSKRTAKKNVVLKKLIFFDAKSFVCSFFPS